MDKKHLPLIVICVLTLIIGISYGAKKSAKKQQQHWTWENAWGPVPPPISPRPESSDEGSEDSPKEERDQPSQVAPTTYDEAIKLAGKLNRPVFVIFSAEWCGPCQKMKQEVWPNPKIQEAMKSYIVLKLDADRSPKESREFNVSYLPAGFIVNSNEKILKQYQRYMDVESLAAWLAN